jgi:hypothetical protein
MLQLHAIACQQAHLAARVKMPQTVSARGMCLMSGFVASEWRCERTRKVSEWPRRELARANQSP